MPQALPAGGRGHHFVNFSMLMTLGMPVCSFWRIGAHLREFPYLNVGTGLDLSIRELAEVVVSATRYQGKIRWDQTKPDGTPKKQLDVSRLNSLGWSSRIPLKEGISSTVALFEKAFCDQVVRL